MRTTSKGLEFPNPFYWDKAKNPFGDILNGLADCTCFAYGAIIEDGHRPCVSRICNANVFHNYLINGWSYIPYDEAKIEVGDIIEWTNKCHVAVVSDSKKNISGSFYTGMHGKSYYGGGFDTRSFTSLEEMSDWMVKNYPTRFFHYWDIATESKWCGGEPDLLLKHPLYSVPENPSVDQIYVSGDDMNVRNDQNEVLKRAEKGFYNVLGWKDANGYRWYEVEKGKYIANVESRVRFIPADKTEVAQLKARIAELEDTLKQISALVDESLKN